MLCQMRIFWPLCARKVGVVNDNSFWTGDNDGMAQKYTDRRHPYTSGLYLSWLKTILLGIMSVAFCQSLRCS